MDSVSVPLNDRSFDLVLLSNWEDQIIYGPGDATVPPASSTHGNLATPINKALDSGAWTQSIIWDPHVPFRDFTQIEFNHEDDVVPEERAPGTLVCSPPVWGHSDKHLAHQLTA